eukprot:2070855-Amphidinium_carterae.1
MVGNRPTSLIPVSATPRKVVSTSFALYCTQKPPSRHKRGTTRVSCLAAVAEDFVLLVAKAHAFSKSGRPLVPPGVECLRFWVQPSTCVCQDLSFAGSP